MDTIKILYVCVYLFVIDCLKKEDIALGLVRSIIDEFMMLISLSCELHRINKYDCLYFITWIYKCNHA